MISVLLLMARLSIFLLVDLEIYYERPPAVIRSGSTSNFVCIRRTMDVALLTLKSQLSSIHFVAIGKLSVCPST